MTTSITFAAAVSLLETTDVLTAEILALLTEPTDGEVEGLATLRATDAVEIAKKTKAAFALELRPLLPEALRSRVASIAGAILDGFRALEITPEVVPVAPAPVPPPTQPIEVKVQLPKSICEMGLSELLTHLSPLIICKLPYLGKGVCYIKDRSLYIHGQGVDILLPMIKQALNSTVQGNQLFDPDLFEDDGSVMFEVDLFFTGREAPKRFRATVHNGSTTATGEARTELIQALLDVQSML